jgi:hypothetical protein
MALGAAPLAHAQLTVASNCTIPTTGTNTAPNQPCWAAGVYNGDYTGTNDVDYIGAPAQATGGHPFTGVTDFTVGNTLGIPDGTVNDIRVDIPPGLVSDPVATPECSDAELNAGTCPADTQLGIVKLEAYLLADFYTGASVYNMPVESSHCSGYVSDYAFTVPVAGRVDICGSLNRQPPYNLYFTIAAPSGAATVSSTLIFWGVPGDSGHKPQSGWKCGLSVLPCLPPATSPGIPSGTPFVTNPTACLPAGQVSTLTLTPTSGSPVTTTVKTPVGEIDCSSLPFSPKLTLALTGEHQTAVGKHPTVLANLTMPSGQANIAASSVTLPLSLALDPKNSQDVCADAAAYVDTCPSNTLVGSASATTPILGVPLTGPVYLVQGVRCASGKATLRALVQAGFRSRRSRGSWSSCGEGARRSTCTPRHRCRTASW